MHTVGIVPKYFEVFRGSLHGSQSVYCFIAVTDALRIGILGNAPDTFDGRITSHKLFHHIHIRAFFGHRNRDHFDAQSLADSKMTVIAGTWAEKLHLVKPAPRFLSHRSEHKQTHHCVKH